jgi:peroxiredoxin
VARLGAAPAGPAGLHQVRFVGRPAPAIEAMAPTTGPTPTNAALRGRVTVLDFWATWCRPCRAAMHVFAGWHRRWSGRGLQIVGLTDEDPNLVAQFAQAAGVPYTLAVDPGSRTARRYAISAIPTMFVLDRSGVVRSVSVGVGPAELRDAEVLIERLLGEPAPAAAPAARPRPMR